MSYQLNSNKGKKHTVWYVLGIVLLICALLFGFGVPSFLSGLAQKLALPLWSSGGAVEKGAASVTSVFRSKNALIEENARLKESLRDVELELLNQDLLKKENHELRELLGRTDESEVVLASILAKPNQTPYDTFILDVGVEDGVSVGDHVLVANTLVIGKIVTAYKSTSKAILYSSPEVETIVTIGKHGVQATAYGLGGGNFGIEVPRDIEVAVGDAIVAPGISGRLFGVVDDIDINPTDSFQVVRFMTPVNIFELEHVLVNISDTQATDIEALLKEDSSDTE